MTPKKKSSTPKKPAAPKPAADLDTALGACEKSIDARKRKLDADLQTLTKMRGEMKVLAEKVKASRKEMAAAKEKIKAVKGPIAKKKANEKKK